MAGYEEYMEFDTAPGSGGGRGCGMGSGGASDWAQWYEKGKNGRAVPSGYGCGRADGCGGYTGCDENGGEEWIWT